VIIYTDYVIYNVSLFTIAVFLFGMFGEYTIERKWMWGVIICWGTITALSILITLGNYLNN